MFVTYHLPVEDELRPTGLGSSPGCRAFKFTDKSRRMKALSLLTPTYFCGFTALTASATSDGESGNWSTV
jgi:hypothetical protein